MGYEPKDIMLARNLRYLRKQRGASYTAQVVAGVLNCKRSSLSGYENGTAEPTIETLVAMGDYYGVSIDRLLRQDIAALDATDRRMVLQRMDMRVLHEELALPVTR